MTDKMPDEIWASHSGTWAFNERNNGRYSSRSRTKYVRADLAPSGDVREASGRVAEFVRQREMTSDGRNDKVYIFHADVSAKEAVLRQSDLKLLIRAVKSASVAEVTADEVRTLFINEAEKQRSWLDSSEITAALINAYPNGLKIVDGKQEVE